jgi:hypothetical protein
VDVQEECVQDECVQEECVQDGRCARAALPVVLVIRQTKGHRHTHVALLGLNGPPAVTHTQP